jgi:acyl dehydratase
MELVWGELSVGQEPESLVNPPIDKLQLVKYAAASGDFNLIHLDEETARKNGLDTIIAHGMLSMGFLGHYAARLAGVNGFVRRIQVRFSKMVYIGDTITCRGKITAIDEASRSVVLEIRAENAAGEKVTYGEAEIVLGG